MAALELGLSADDLITLHSLIVPTDLDFAKRVKVFSTAVRSYLTTASLVAGGTILSFSSDLLWPREQVESLVAVLYPQTPHLPPRQVSVKTS
jgi:hypothetical protein